jgi:hypothetical protein
MIVDQTRAEAVASQLRKRAADAKVGKKGADVVAAFNTLATLVDAYDNGDSLYLVIETYIDGTKLN